MFRWLSALWKKPDLSSIFLAVLFSVGLMILPEGLKLELSQRTAPVLFFPFNRGVSFIAEQVRLEQENRELRRELAHRSTEKGQSSILEAENEFWRKTYALRLRGRFRFVPCEIVAKGAGMAVSTMLLNKGTIDSIQTNQPVIAPRGLIGKVVSVGPATCFVRTILDTTLHVSAIIKRTHRAGILEWDRGTDHCLLTKIPVAEDVKEGDEVLTSGMGGVFPPGLPIGRIVRIGKEPTGFFLNILVSPYARLDRLSAALVVVGEDTTEIPSTDSLSVFVVKIKRDSLAATSDLRGRPNESGQNREIQSP